MSLNVDELIEAEHVPHSGRPGTAGARFGQATGCRLENKTPKSGPGKSPRKRASAMRILWPVCLVLVLLSVVVASRASQTPSVPEGARREETPLDATLHKARQARAAGHLLEARQLYQQAIQMVRSEPDDGRKEANILIEMASVCEPEEAIAGIKRAMALHEKALGPESASVAGDLSTLALFCHGQTGCADTEQYHKQALAIEEQLPPRDRWTRIVVLNNAAAFYRRQKNYPETEKLLREAIDIADSSPARGDPDVMGVRSALASLYQEEGRPDDAEEILRSTAPTIGGASDGGRNAEIAGAQKEQRLAQEYQNEGRLNEAETYFEHALAVFEKAPQRSQPSLVLMDLQLLGRLYRQQGRDPDAEQCFLRALDVQQQAAHEHPHLARVIGYVFDLQNLYRDQGRLGEMEPIYLRVAAIQEVVLGPSDRALGLTLESLARVYSEENKYEDAVPVYERALHIEETSLGSDSPNLVVFLDEYASLLEKVGRTEEAVGARARAEKIRKAKEK